MRISDWSSDVCSSDLEIWAFALRRGAERPLTPAYYFGLSLPLYLGWIATTTLGAIFGGVLQDPARYGLDFAFTAVFLTLLVSLWKDRKRVVEGKSVSVRVDLGGSRILNKKKNKTRT